MSPLVELKCSNCGSQLQPEDISPQLFAARCRHCNALFTLPGANTTAKIPRPQVALPKPFQVQTTLHGLVITRRWLSGGAFFLLFFTLFWNAFLIVWHSIALSQGAWFMSLFALIHTGVGIFLIYYVLASFLNTTTIKVSTDTLSIHSGPLPWPGNKIIDPQSLKQLYCKEKVSHGKNGPSYSYSIEAVLHDLQHETLIKSLPSSDQALFLEQQIEQHLQIRDTPVEGEYGR